MTRAGRRWTVALAASVVLLPQPAFAHGAAGPADDVATLLIVGAIAVVAWYRRLGRSPEPASVPRALRPALLIVAAALVVAAVTTPGWVPRRTPSKTRPVTAARLAIESPTIGTVTGPDVDVRLRLDGGRLAPATAVKGGRDEGHVHLMVDGRLVSMTGDLRSQVRGLAPGHHLLQAEFVAVDHGSFRTPVIAAVAFDVG